MATENKMEYVRLGKSGLKISKLVLGCMSFGSPNWAPWVLGEEEGIAQVKLAYDLGINAFDTANSYSHGRSEIILGKAIKQHKLPRDEIVVMTKAFGTVSREDEPTLARESSETLDKKRYANQNGLGRKNLFATVKQCLERLQLDYVDLLQCHRFDPHTPVSETMHALHDLVQSGQVRYIGMSSCYAWQFYKMQSYAREHGLTEFISMQNFYNPLYREEEREMMPMLKDLGVGVIPWSPLAHGYAARPWSEAKTTVRSNQDKGTPSIIDTPFAQKVSETIEAIAQKHGVSMAQITLAWALSKDFVTAPIIGTTSNDKLKDLVGCINVKLTAEEVEAIDAPYQARKIMGHS